MRAGWLTSGVLIGLMLGHSFAQQTSPMIDAPSYTRAQLSAQNTGPDKWQREVPPAEGIAAPTSNFPRRYQPLSGPQKFNIFLKTTYSPGTFVSAAFDAGLMQAQGDLGDNLLREFWPDIRERLLRHRSTARMENIAERVQNPRFHH